LLPLVANIGDFSMSLIKRHFGFKDYGKLLGAHGGVLDRVDSLMFSCAFASVLVVIFENGWRFFA
jgi:phosphatidate cytidylyltransferase